MIFFKESDVNMRITESRLRRIIRSVIKESAEIDVEKIKESNDAFIQRLGFKNKLDKNFQEWFNKVNPDRSQGYDGRKSGWGGQGALFGNAVNTQFNLTYYTFGLCAVLQYEDIKLPIKLKHRYTDPKLRKISEEYEKLSTKEKLENVNKFLNLFGKMFKGNLLNAGDKDFQENLRQIISNHKGLDAFVSEKGGYGEYGVSKMRDSGVHLFVLKKIVHAMEATYKKMEEVKNELLETDESFDVDEEGFSDGGHEFMLRMRNRNMR